MEAARRAARRRSFTSGGLQGSHAIAPPSPDELRRRRAPERRPDVDRLTDAGAAFDAEAIHAPGPQPPGRGWMGRGRSRRGMAGRRPRAPRSKTTPGTWTPA